MESLAYPYAVLAFRNSHPQTAADAPEGDRPAVPEATAATPTVAPKPTAPRPTHDVVAPLPF
jgi:hypothetical protein